MSSRAAKARGTAAVEDGQAFPPAPGTTEVYDMIRWNNRGGPTGRKNRCYVNGIFEPATAIEITNNELP